MRTWQLTTRYAGVPDLQILLYPYERQAYRFAIDWFVEDPELEFLELIDESGHADTLTLRRAKCT